MKKLFSLLLVSTLVVCAGCTNWERQTFQTLAASKATIDQAQVDYEAGKLIPHNQLAYTTINSAKIAQAAAVNQMVAYEQLKSTGGSASALAVDESQVVAAVAELPTIIIQVKALYTTGAKVDLTKVVITTTSGVK
jgi:hypothetical protein